MFHQCGPPPNQESPSAVSQAGVTEPISTVKAVLKTLGSYAGTFSQVSVLATNNDTDNWRFIGMIIISKPDAISNVAEAH